MSPPVVAPIVEGHGEVNSAIRIVITRVWTELLGGDYVEVLKPVRQPRTKLVQRDGLLRAIDFADLKIKEVGRNDHAMILVVFDADEDPRVCWRRSFSRSREASVVTSTSRSCFPLLNSKRGLPLPRPHSRSSSISRSSPVDRSRIERATQRNRAQVDAWRIFTHGRPGAVDRGFRSDPLPFSLAVIRQTLSRA